MRELSLLWASVSVGRLGQRSTACAGPGSALTDVVLHQLLHRVELGPCGDVVATCVQLADLVMLHVITSGLVPIPNGQGVRACGEGSPLDHLSSSLPVWKPGDAQKAGDSEVEQPHP